MKRSMLFVIPMLLACQILCAESLRPNQVVLHLIKSAKNNDLYGVIETADLIKIAALPRHGLSPRELIVFLQDIDLKKIKFQKRDINSRPQKVTVRMVLPLSIDFDLELQSAEKKQEEDYYLVVGVHP